MNDTRLIMLLIVWLSLRDLGKKIKHFNISRGDLFLSLSLSFIFQPYTQQILCFYSNSLFDVLKISTQITLSVIKVIKRLKGIFYWYIFKGNWIGVIFVRCIISCFESEITLLLFQIISINYKCIHVCICCYLCVFFFSSSSFVLMQIIYSKIGWREDIYAYETCT